MRGVCSRCVGRSRLSVRLCAGAAEGIESVCRHHCLYPERLRADPIAPDVLSVHGGVERMRTLLAEKVVAIVGAREPSDYGRRIARALARDLSASGVTVAGVEEGVDGAACAGAKEAGGGVAILAGTWEFATPAGPCSLAWPASERAIAFLADLVIVVEGGEGDWDPASADEARSRGVRMAAVPGPVDAVSSLASNALIAEGADIIREAQDALDVLYGVGRRRVRRPRRRPRKRLAIVQPAPVGEAPLDAARPSVIESSPAAEPPPAFDPPPRLESHLVAVLERVENGQDTLAKLCVGRPTCDELTVALTELELLGLLGREGDGRYRKL